MWEPLSVPVGSHGLAKLLQVRLGFREEVFRLQVEGAWKKLSTCSCCVDLRGVRVSEGKQRRLLATFSPGSQAVERGGCQMRSKQYYLEKTETFASPL